MRQMGMIIDLSADRVVFGRFGGGVDLKVTGRGHYAIPVFEFSDDFRLNKRIVNKEVGSSPPRCTTSLSSKVKNVPVNPLGNLPRDPAVPSHVLCHDDGIRDDGHAGNAEQCDEGSPRHEPTDNVELDPIPDLPEDGEGGPAPSNLMLKEGYAKMKVAMDVGTKESDKTYMAWYSTSMAEASTLRASQGHQEGTSGKGTNDSRALRLWDMRRPNLVQPLATYPRCT